MSPFPIEAIEEVIWRIDEAIGPRTKDNPASGWIREANTADVVKFLSGLRDRLGNARHALTDAAHQSWLKEDNETETVVLRPKKKALALVSAAGSSARPKRVLVIDDSSMMRVFVERFVPGVTVEHVFRIPEDVSELKLYDALVVDGQGIGNSRWRHGLDFCKEYEKPEGQAVVFYSGLRAHGEDAAELERRGIANLSKGCNPEKLALAVRFAMERRTGGAE